MIDDVFLWDRSERTFKPRPVCPHVHCGAGLDKLGGVGLGRCGHCGGLYEAVMLPSPFEPGLTVEWARRAQARHCTLTGERLVWPSLVDWSEAGGSSGRNFCVPDFTGQVFGPPSDRRSLALGPRPRWTPPEVVRRTQGAFDCVGSLSIVKGSLVAVTRRGAVAVIDPATGEVRGRGEWPGPSLNAIDPDQAVGFPPAAIDTYLAVVSATGAAFRNLALELGFESPGGRPRLVAPSNRDACFTAAPTVVGGAGGRIPLFCLLEADIVAGRQEGARLRFFTAAGAEVARLAPNIAPARPPLFHRGTGELLLLDSGDASLYAFRPDQLPAEPPAAGQALPEFTHLSWPSRQVQDGGPAGLTPSSRPTFVHAENSAGEPELWLLHTEAEQLVLYAAGVRDVFSGGPWSWRRYPLGWADGEPNGLAVGRGSAQLHGTADLVAVCTDRGAYVYKKGSRADDPVDTLRGPEGQGTQGSHEPPILCGAGVLVRTQGALQVGQLGTRWAGTFNPNGRLTAAIDGGYPHPQGLVCLGTTCYAGAGLTVQAFDIAARGEG